ncbi:MAG TPA: hypothetical protein PKA00_09010 [Saprospiraceae bacterium]|nr:hypothetical protein [Saprospiraceae bacterium]HMQ83035.1 hypothetical protein [Saprospiraceae bacterium]
MKKYLALLATVFTVSFLVVSCEKESEPTTDEVATEVSEDVAIVEDLYQDTEDEVDLQLETRGGGNPSNTCPTVTADPDFDTFPRTVTIDYGTDGCEGPDGRIRRGIIQVWVSDSFHIPGAQRILTFVDFYLDDAHIEGTKTLTNEGYDADGNRTISRTVQNGMITFPNGETVSWESAHLMTQIEGADTPFLYFDNVFEITGGATGINRNGVPFTSTITEPLIKRKNCLWIVSGERTVEAEDHQHIMDYGDGNCDRFAMVTLDSGISFQVIIRPWWRL